MTDDPRASLTTLVAAFERHLEACASRGGDDDPTVLAAADDLADAFDAYDDALLAAYGEMTPLEVYDGPDDDEDDEEDEDDEDDEDDDGGSGERGPDSDAVDDHDDEDGEDGMYSGLEGDFEWAPRTAEDDPTAR